MQGAKSEKTDSARSGPAGGVLGRCLVDGDPEASAGARRRRRKIFVASLAIEFLLLTLLVVTPLLSVAKPQRHKVAPPQMTFLGPWHVHHEQPSNAPANAPARGPALVNPLPPLSPHLEPSNPGSVTDSEEGPDSEIPPGYPDGGLAQTIEMGRPAMVEEPPRIEPPVSQPPKRTLRVSEGVLQAQLILRIDPRYPTLAVQTRREGTVLLHAIIGRDGRIASLDVVSGDPLLVQAALDAVRQWRYRPTMLNGEAIDVDTSITINFRLHPQ